ncbi:MAG: TonB-dependent receptor plug domain-containing protein, partial [Gammaproteobacteria bacterium]|nr:TonB-dependent receptor plug domain-containing protein [Gammaproteobacteria bacterium]
MGNRTMRGCGTRHRATAGTNERSSRLQEGKIVTYSKLTRLGWTTAAIAMALGTIATAAAAADERKISLDIERKNAGAALVELGESAGIQIAVPSGISGEKELGPINGRYTVVEALDSMLKDSGLAYHFAANDSVAIGLDEAAPDGGGDGGGAIDAAMSDDDEDDDVELIVVTGSRIARQPGQMDRQVAVYDRLDIEATGAGTLEEFMRRIPQSFNAPTSNGAAFAGTFGSTSNYFGAAGVNLRGLGERATLVLIDGKRTARGGVLGEATDINQIPLSMIENIEVIFDGASAIYGADAVGGVVNVITRKDYQGVDASITHNQPAGGGTADTIFSLGATRSWGDANTGSVTVSYEYATRDPLNGDERELRFATSTTVDEPPYGWPPNLQASPRYDFATNDFIPVPLFLLDADGNPVPVGDPTGVTEVFRSRMPDDSDGMLTLADFKGLEPVPGSFPEAGLGLLPGRDDHSWRVRMRQELTDTLAVSGSVSLTTGDTYVLESNQNRVLTAAPRSEGLRRT